MPASAIDVKRGPERDELCQRGEQGVDIAGVGLVTRRVAHSGADVSAMYGFFVDGNLGSFKQNCHLASRLALARLGRLVARAHDVSAFLLPEEMGTVGNATVPYR
ncbi:hypothetical protein CSQ95_10595 [Janthinobacterium sp. BJB304]|nr:hypothetical protein CSQ95_10595 [Janthinobacterium sp. BJB304]